MGNWKIFALGLLLAAGAASARADAAAFDVRPGLWEMTMTVSGLPGGTPLVQIPPQALARLSAEQRAKVEAAMQRWKAKPGGVRILRSCLTAEQLRREPDFANRPGSSCTRSFTKRTATEIAGHLTCTDKGATVLSSTFDLRALSREAIVGTTQGTVHAGPDTRTVQEKISSKWLGPDCGAVKP